MHICRIKSIRGHPPTLEGQWLTKTEILEVVIFIEVQPEAETLQSEIRLTIKYKKKTSDEILRRGVKRFNLSFRGTDVV